MVCDAKIGAADCCRIGILSTSSGLMDSSGGAVGEAAGATGGAVGRGVLGDGVGFGGMVYLSHILA